MRAPGSFCPRRRVPSPSKNHPGVFSRRTRPVFHPPFSSQASSTPPPLRHRCISAGKTQFRLVFRPRGPATIPTIPGERERRFIAATRNRSQTVCPPRVCTSICHASAKLASPAGRGTDNVNDAPTNKYRDAAKVRFNWRLTESRKLRKARRDFEIGSPGLARGLLYF